MITTLNVEIEIANVESNRLYLRALLSLVVCLYGLPSTWTIDKVTTPTISRLIKYFLKFNGKEMHYFFYIFSCYPFINLIVKRADILPVIEDQSLLDMLLIHQLKCVSLISLKIIGYTVSNWFYYQV